jgi:hypothetical protein
MDRTGLKILENNKNIQSIISVNTNILLRRFRLKFLRIMCSTLCYKERVNFENTLYSSFNERSKDIRCLASKINSLSTNSFLESVQPPLLFLFLFFLS